VVERSRPSRSIALQRSSPLRPVPRWSKPSTSNSRTSPGTSKSTLIISSTPAPPGPPERYMSGGLRGFATRATRSPIRPGSPPERSSGTRTVAQRTPPTSGQPRQPVPAGEVGWASSFASAGAPRPSPSASHPASAAVVIARRRARIRQRL
jgi:hypothetical protein